MVAEVKRVANRTDMAAITPRTVDDTVELIEPGREGIFVWSTANLSTQVAYDARQGVYVPPTGQNGSSGAWVRRFETHLEAEWFGMVGDGSADNSDAMDGLLAFLAGSKGSHGETFYPAVQAVRFGLGKYYFSRTIHLKIPVVFEGITPIGAVTPTTQLDFLTGGFICHRFNTKASTSPPFRAQLDNSAGRTGADGSIFRNLYCTSRQTRPSDANYAAQAMDGLLSFCAIQIDNCAFDGFTRDGVSLQSSNVTGTGVDGNTDLSHLEGVHALYNGRHGIHLEGVDSNQITCRRCNVRFNNNWGIYDSGFLGNQHYDHHAAYNGGPAGTIWAGRSKGDSKTSVVRYRTGGGGGTDYYISPGRLSDAITTTPGSNNAVWVKQMEGAGSLGVDSEGAIPEWSSLSAPYGDDLKEGGSYYIDSITPSAATNLYCELGQGQPFAGSVAAHFLSGNVEGNPNSIGTFTSSAEGYLTNRFGKGFKPVYVDPATGKTRAAYWGYALGGSFYFALTDDDYFPAQGWSALLTGGNLSFGYNHAGVPGISFVVSGPNGGMGCPNYVRKDVTWIPRLALGAVNRRVLDVDTAAPTSGAWDAGSIVFNASPSAGGKIGWVCVTGGAPGTWKAFGPIDA